MFLQFDPAVNGKKEKLYNQRYCCIILFQQSTANFCGHFVLHIFLEWLCEWCWFVILQMPSIKSACPGSKIECFAVQAIGFGFGILLIFLLGLFESAIRFWRGTAKKMSNFDEESKSNLWKSALSYRPYTHILSTTFCRPHLKLHDSCDVFL